MVRPVTQTCFSALMMDVWPSPAAIVDFGIDTQEHYRVLQSCIRSGNITLENVEEYAEAGVERISVGAITHSPEILDFSLEIL